ncbi:MAG: hypothetical protein Q8M24_21220 [Pseudolabrys sp.]|nr:hypothetical protein [Pseudolabrys sp.]MDP2297969.1 hypothetical protein [Pseudolabrys sp.]
MAIPTTRERVPTQTSDAVNQSIETGAEKSVRLAADNPGLIAPRLNELDAEWDIERAIEMNASTIAFLGVILGFFLHPYWLVLPALVTLFLFQHAVQGWCPPVPILRRFGFRTSYEIDRERYALKALRGDFQPVLEAANRAKAAWDAARPN